MPSIANAFARLFTQKRPAVVPPAPADSVPPGAGEPFLQTPAQTAQAAQAARIAELEAQLGLFTQAMAVIEYRPDGRILSANEGFLRLFGFSAAEITGRTHEDLLAPADRGSAEYRALWDRLRGGESASRLHERAAGNGREVWTQSFYASLRGPDGAPIKIVELAMDVTQQTITSFQLQATMVEIQRVVKLSVAGDLVTRVHCSGVSGDISRLCEDVNSVLNARMVLIRRVQLLTEDVRSAAEEISRGNGSLSQLTESQAASLEETASSMEEMTSSVKSSADNAAQAREFSLAAKQQAEAGGIAVGAAVTAMTEINSSSKKMADIIGVIDEIAFQTNLLALNAAVEAARAGEGGRGFAVVASEVRSLAGRSATAAKEIKALIQDSVNKVADGSKLVDASGKTLAGILTSVNRVTEIVSMIAASSAEQSVGIEQVNKAVMQIDEATQQNAALVEQTAAASQAIVDQVQELHSVVARYKVEPDVERAERGRQAA